MFCILRYKLWSVEVISFYYNRYSQFSLSIPFLFTLSICLILIIIIIIIIFITIYYLDFIMRAPDCFIIVDSRAINQIPIGQLIIITLISFLAYKSICATCSILCEYSFKKHGKKILSGNRCMFKNFSKKSL